MVVKGGGSNLCIPIQEHDYDSLKTMKHSSGDNRLAIIPFLNTFPRQQKGWDWNANQNSISFQQL